MNLDDDLRKARNHGRDDRKSDVSIAIMVVMIVIAKKYVSDTLETGTGKWIFIESTYRKQKSVLML